MVILCTHAESVHPGHCRCPVKLLNQYPLLVGTMGQRRRALYDQIGCSMGLSSDRLPEQPVLSSLAMHPALYYNEDHFGQESTVRSHWDTLMGRWRPVPLDRRGHAYLFNCRLSCSLKSGAPHYPAATQIFVASSITLAMAAGSLRGCLLLS